MGLHGSIEDFFWRVMKSSGHIKYFRHQCTALITISRHCWKLAVEVEIKEHGSVRGYDWFQELIATSEPVLQDVINLNSSERPNYDQLQKELDNVTTKLGVHWQKLNGITNGQGQYNPMNLMIEARKKDQERNKAVLSSEKLIKFPTPKDTVDFYVHDGGKSTQIISLKLSKESTAEEVIFRLGREAVAIKLHHNASFYAYLEWGGWIMNTYSQPKSSNTWGGYPEQGPVDFTTHLSKLASPRRLYVLVDRNPCIQILLTDAGQTRFYSLVKLFEGQRCVVLKDLGGTLHHGQQVFNGLIYRHAQGSEYKVYRSEETHRRLEDLGPDEPSNDYIGQLIQTHRKIRIKDLAFRWLIQIMLNDQVHFNRAQREQSTLAIDSITELQTENTSHSAGQIAGGETLKPSRPPENKPAHDKGKRPPVDALGPKPKFLPTVKQSRASRTDSPLPSIGQIAGGSTGWLSKPPGAEVESGIFRNPPFDGLGQKQKHVPEVGGHPPSLATGSPTVGGQVSSASIEGTSDRFGANIVHGVAKDRVKALVEKYEAHGKDDGKKKKSEGFIRRWFGGKKG